VPLYYLRGGGMLLRATVTPRDEDPIPLLVDSARPFPLFLREGAWKKAGIDVKSLSALPDVPGVRRGVVPTFRMGGFDLAKMPAIEGGVEMGAQLAGLDVDLAGIVGADLLAFFRVTFADDGRFIWIEPDPSLLGADTQASGRSTRPPAPPSSPASSTPAPSSPAPSPSRSPFTTSTP
jgi:hypothetical protein